MTRKDIVNQIINDLKENEGDWLFGDHSIPKNKNIDNVNYLTNQKKGWVFVVNALEDGKPVMARPFIWRFGYWEGRRLRKAFNNWKATRLYYVTKSRIKKNNKETK